jgi:hypothetical protein
VRVQVVAAKAGFVLRVEPADGALNVTVRDVDGVALERRWPRAAVVDPARLDRLRGCLAWEGGNARLRFFTGVDRVGSAPPLRAIGVRCADAAGLPPAEERPLPSASRYVIRLSVPISGIDAGAGTAGLDRWLGAVRTVTAAVGSGTDPAIAHSAVEAATERCIQAAGGEGTVTEVDVADAGGTLLTITPFLDRFDRCLRAAGIEAQATDG